MKRLSKPCRILGFAAVGLISLGCAPQTSQMPAWPEQPSPSYPTPDGSTEVAKPAAELDTDLDTPAPEQKSPPAASGSSLAKEYDGKKSLDTLKGKATYYADSLAGNHTANGDIYDPMLFTGAHKKLKFGTIVRVIREDNGAVTYIRINDRGPFGSADRIIDLSKAAAQELDMMRAGVVTVRVEILERPGSK